MQIYALLETCELLLGQARAETMNENGAEAERNLVKLRQLLDSQPELEAGGSHRERSSKYAKKH